jgi:glycosyltransferase involved in cell wall biosynthesis
MDEKWVTILTPIFNGIEYFEDCYNGIINQTEQNYIWIIGVNGHGDETNDIYIMLKNKINDKRIIVKNYLTKGKVNTLNLMMEEVNTKYVALCDCDDIWFPKKLEIQKSILDNNDFIDVLGTNLQYIGELNHIPKLPFGKITFDILFTINPVVNSSVILKKECCKWEDRFGLDDYDLWFRLLIKNKNIITVPYPMILHRVYQTSAFNNSGVQDVSGLLDFYKNDVTVVTAYYQIKSKFTIQDYIQWMKFWGKIHCKLVFFTTNDFVPFIENIRKDLPTKIVALEFEELDGIKKYGNDFWKNEYNKDHEKYHTPELYILWYEKKGFVKKAIDINPFNTSKFVWCDAGICRNEEWIPHILNFPKAYKIPDNKFSVLRITDFEKYDDFQKINCVGGGILAASKDIWLQFYDKYDFIIQEYVSQNKFVGKDQSIIASLIKKEPDFFNIIEKINGFDDFIIWFSLLFIFSN